MTRDTFRPTVYGLEPAPDAPIPLCSACVEGIGGACAGPDCDWRPARPGEACAAADCASKPTPTGPGLLVRVPQEALNEPDPAARGAALTRALYDAAIQVRRLLSDADRDLLLPLERAIDELGAVEDHFLSHSD